MCSNLGSAAGLAAALGAGRRGNPGSSPFRHPLLPRCPPWKALPGCTFPGMFQSRLRAFRWADSLLVCGDGPVVYSRSPAHRGH